MLFNFSRINCLNVGPRHIWWICFVYKVFYAYIHTCTQLVHECFDNILYIFWTNAFDLCLTAWTFLRRKTISAVPQCGKEAQKWKRTKRNLASNSERNCGMWTGSKLGLHHQGERKKMLQYGHLLKDNPARLRLCVDNLKITMQEKGVIFRCLHDFMSKFFILFGFCLFCLGFTKR